MQTALWDAFIILNLKNDKQAYMIWWVWINEHIWEILSFEFLIAHRFFIKSKKLLESLTA